MIKLHTVSYHDCTMGRLFYGSKQCFTLELPWLGNETGVSCIPSGYYWYFKRESEKNGSVIELQGVPQRSVIQIHSGNYSHQTAGCILVGDSVRFLDSDLIPDVTNSKATMKSILESVTDKGYIEVRRAL